jgi:hypothetical protein
VRPRQREAIGRLTARPAESEHPGVEINHFQELAKLKKTAKEKEEAINNETILGFSSRYFT